MEFDAQMDKQIEQKTFNRLAYRILFMERENFKTKKFSATEMTEKIRKLIEFEVDKNGD